MILLDRSSNMQGAFAGTSTSKTLAVQNALANTIETYQGRVKFGFGQFPDPDTKSTNCAHSSACCVAKQPPVLPQYNALDAILAALQCNDPQACLSASSDSPSNAALAAVKYYQFSSPDQYVLLIASGEPSCGPDGSSDDACRAAVNGATSLGNMGISVVVLSVGDEPDPRYSCLVSVSKVGNKKGMPGNTLRFYAPTSVSSLKDNLSSLFAATARSSCTLNTSDDVPDDATLQVKLGYSTTVPQADCSASYGWCFAPNIAFHNQIMLLGSACDQYLAMPPATDILAAYTCSTCSESGTCVP
jgi:hypothetical protein